MGHSVFNSESAVVKDESIRILAGGQNARWLVFLHTADWVDVEMGKDGLPVKPWRGTGRLGEILSRYVVVYEDGAEEVFEIRRRHQIGMVNAGWGENCFQAVANQKPFPRSKFLMDVTGVAQTKGTNSKKEVALGIPLRWANRQEESGLPDRGPWINWLCAWENPSPEKKIAAIRLEPVCGVPVLSAITFGQTISHPLRWESRRKAVYALPAGVEFDSGAPKLDHPEFWKHLQLDMGQIISIQNVVEYDAKTWVSSKDPYPQRPEISQRKVLIEYAAHSEAFFHIVGGKAIKVSDIDGRGKMGAFRLAKPAGQRVRLRVVNAKTRRPVAVRLHVHGENGEYLPPMDRHRMPNSQWFEEYGADLTSSPGSPHHYAYIAGETELMLPRGKVFVEVYNGFEVRPVRQVFVVDAATEELTLTVEKVLPWRERGWITADTHVHFLSPGTANLEGAAEGINVVNLLASQWGELMTNCGDFDGRTVFGTKASGGDGEHLVRVSTENRQHVLGHISLIGYSGNIINPLCCGDPGESAIDDAVDTLMMQWALQCRKQGGIVVIPHLPDPRAENAACIVDGHADAIEFCAVQGAGLNPYSVGDWYRYLNCGYHLPAVGGTDKMFAWLAVGKLRTYSKLAPDREFSFDSWMDSIRSGN